MLYKNEELEGIVNELGKVKGYFDKMEKVERSVLLCGDTGSGKSTLINLLSGRKMVTKEIENYYDLAVDCDNQTAKIGHSCVRSETDAFIKLYNISGVFYWDCPGFEDSNGDSSDIVNAYAISRIAKKSSEIKILAAVNEVGIKNKAESFLHLIQRLVKIFSKSNIDDKVVFCFTKSGAIFDHKKEVSKILSEIEKPNGIVFEKTGVDFLEKMVDLDRFVEFKSPEEYKIDAVGVEIPVESIRNVLLEKIDSLQFIKNPTIKPVVSAKTQEYFEKYFYKYLVDEVERVFEESVTKVAESLNEYSSKGSLSEFDLLLNKIKDVLSFTYQKDFDFLDRVFHLTMNKHDEKNLERIKFILDECIEFLSAEIIEKSRLYIHHKELEEQKYDSLLIAQLSKKLGQETIKILEQSNFDKNKVTDEVSRLNELINEEFEKKASYKKEKVEPEVVDTCCRCEVFIVDQINYDMDYLNDKSFINLAKIIGLNNAIDLFDGF